MCSSLMPYFTIKRCSFIYQKVGKNKMVSKYGLIEILLNDDKWDYMMKLYGHNIIVRNKAFKIIKW